MQKVNVRFKRGHKHLYNAIAKREEDADLHFFTLEESKMWTDCREKCTSQELYFILVYSKAS